MLAYLFKSLCFVTLLFITWSCESKEGVKVLKEYTVTFNSNGGSAIDSIKVKENTKVIKPSPDPVKQDSVFLEWRLGGKKYNFNTPVTGDITLTAVWHFLEWDTVAVGSGVKLTRYYGTATAVVVLDTIDGKKVLEIGAYIFGQSATIINTSITGVDISKATQLRTIGNSTFRNCWVLARITFPSSLVTIADYAFFYCQRLTDITLPSSLITIGNQAFDSCNSLTLVTLERSASPLTTITSSTFRNTPFTSTTTTIRYPSGANYKAEDGWENLQATFEAK